MPWTGDDELSRWDGGGWLGATHSLLLHLDEGSSDSVEGVAVLLYVLGCLSIDFGGEGGAEGREILGGKGGGGELFIMYTVDNKDVVFF